MKPRWYEDYSYHIYQTYAYILMLKILKRPIPESLSRTGTNVFEWILKHGAPDD